MSREAWESWIKWSQGEATKYKAMSKPKLPPKLMILARRIPGQLTSIIMRDKGTSLSGGFSLCKNRRDQYDLMAAEIKTHDPFQRYPGYPNRTGQIPIWRVGEVIALGVTGSGKL